MTPEEVVKTLFARVQARDASAMDLFAPDATRVAPDGTFAGRVAILEYYEMRWRGGMVAPGVEAVFAQPPVVVALLRPAPRDGKVVRVVDVFEVEDGLIRRLHVCRELAEGSR